MGRQHQKSAAETYKVPANEPERVKGPSDSQDADSAPASAWAAQCEWVTYKANDGNGGPRKNIKQIAESM